ncbi:MAG: acyloxyacyl hydrolase [Winogradskyella sp.]
MRNYSLYIILCMSFLVVSQEKPPKNTYLDLSYFSGNIALHNTDISHLIKGHPEGFIFSWNKKTFGDQAWEQRYNYPDYGASINYQDFKNDVLGTNFGLYAHYNFYFFRRHIMLRIAQGLAYTTKPYHKTENPKNIAFGSKILSSTYMMLTYKKERIYKRFGFQVGAFLVHYSNANIKAPNTSTNTVALHFGLHYNLENETPTYIKNLSDTSYTEPIRYNLAFRSGINQSDVVGSGQFPFYIVSAYADKRLSHTSAIQLGTDVFFSKFLKELIAYKSVAFPEETVSGDEDYKRVGLFAGHELFVNKMSVVTQFGYYVYYPFDFEGRTYLRLGLKRYFKHKLFAAVTLKSHGAKAEAVEFGIGIRL